MPPLPSSTSLTITNPLTLYRAHVAASRLLPDPAQHRIALKLQETYHRLLDYDRPPPELNTRLAALSSALSHTRKPEPTFIHRLNKERREKALIRVVSSTESAIEANTPRGFYLSGEVGTGKSLLLDLLYHSLPHPRKQRWHFHQFMLLLYRELSRSHSGHEHVLLSIARDLVERTPVVFLDEMQFPDRTAAKIASELLIRFWALGGVLIASSNREAAALAKGAGATRSGEFEHFISALEARCEEEKIEGGTDWRRQRKAGWWRVGSPVRDAPENADPASTETGLSHDVDETDTAENPPYFFPPSGTHTSLQSLLSSPALAAVLPPDDSWTSHTITVYGRAVTIPHFSNGVAIFSFAELCEATLGPADYLAICGEAHTIILHSIPMLSHAKKKNEARRFITFLDAVYESGVKLAIQTTMPISPDELLFPDLQTAKSPTKSAEGGMPAEDSGPVEGSVRLAGDVQGFEGVEAETFAEAFESASFRPNVLNTPAEDAEVVESQMRSFAQATINYRDQRAFTGEDEVFAARRATSRVWEVCGKGWWEGVAWTPMKENVAGETRDLERETSPKVDPREKPKFEERHFWSLGLWGKRAGEWGKGVEGDRKKDRT